MKVLGPRSEDPRIYRRAAASPLLLGAQVTVSPGNTAAPKDLLGLKNPSGKGMEILAIQWRWNPARGLPHLLGCKLDLGTIPVTNGHVPICALTRNLTWGNNDISGRVSFKWELPKPLYVPPGGVLAPSFHHAGLDLDPYVVDIVYAAREVAHEPKTVNIPYASAFVSKAFQGTTVYDSSASDPTDLLNPFDTPLRLQRLTGWVAMYYFFGSGGVAPPYGLCPASPESYLLVDHITDSKGRPWVQNPAPFYNGFFYGDQSWELDGAVLEPETFLDVLLTYSQMGTITVLLDQIDPFIQPMLALIGHREVAL